MRHSPLTVLTVKGLSSPLAFTYVAFKVLRFGISVASCLSARTITQMSSPDRSQQANIAESIALHIPFLTRLVCSLVRQRQMVDDIVQQTALKALLNAHQFRFESSLKTWLSSIAINEIRQEYRSPWGRRAVSLTPEILKANETQRSDFPHSAYEANEHAIGVRQAVLSLPQKYRTVVELCDLQCLPLKEAARTLGLTLPAVKSRHHRARQKLERLVTRFSGSAL